MTGLLEKSYNIRLPSRTCRCLPLVDLLSLVLVFLPSLQSSPAKEQSPRRKWTISSYLFSTQDKSRPCKFSNACKAEQIANYIGGTLHIGNAAAGEMLKPDVVGKEAYSLKDGPFSRARPLSRCDIMQQALRNFPATRQSLHCKCSVDCIGLKFLRHCCSSFKFHHKSSPTLCQNWGPALT